MRLAGSLLLAVVLLSAGPAGAAPQSPPNFIVILMDDMGWRDVGFMGNKFVETPNIDGLAKTGLTFTQAYASAPNCAPTRACLMSGHYTPRHGIYTVVDPRQPAGSPWQKLLAAHSESELATDVVTLPESLKARGYATSFFGMWNLGRGRSGPRTPGGQGFDTVVFPETIGFGKDAYFDDKGNYLSDRLTDEVLTFVENNRARPFFVYLADHSVHSPYDPKPDLVAKYEQKAKADNDRRNDPASSAVREGEFKLVEFFEDGGRVELYNLRDDPGEKRDLAGKMPEKTTALTTALHAWHKQTNAAIPREPNPAYDPKADRPRGRRT